MAEGYENIYGNLYSKANVYSGTFTTETLLGPSDNAIYIDLPQGITYDKVLGLSFVTCQPNSAWSSMLYLWNYTKNSDTRIAVSGRVIGSDTQSYKIRYLIFYKD